jgi:hypothetical protein
MAMIVTDLRTFPNKRLAIKVKNQSVDELLSEGN